MEAQKSTTGISDFLLLPWPSVDSCDAQVSSIHSCWHRGHEQDLGRSSNMQLFAMLAQCSRQNLDWEVMDKKKSLALNLNLILGFAWSQLQ